MNEIDRINLLKKELNEEYEKYINIELGKGRFQRNAEIDALKSIILGLKADIEQLKANLEHQNEQLHQKESALNDLCSSLKGAEITVSRRVNGAKVTWNMELDGNSLKII